MTSVWPALWPPWKRTTMSACSDNQSTILPFPSSPHWAPTTTTLAIRRFSLCNSSLQKSMTNVRKTGPHHQTGSEAGGSEIMRPAQITAAAARMRGSNRIKEAAALGKPERHFGWLPRHFQAIDIPGKFLPLSDLAGTGYLVV